MADRIQAKHLDAGRMTSVISHIEATEHRWTMVRDLADALPEFPIKVILAKARKLIASGRIDGCACGCRGDFSIPEPVCQDDTHHGYMRPHCPDCDV